MIDKTNDPTAVWQRMLGEMEKNFNAFANQAMSSPEFSQAMNQASGAAAAVQKQFGDSMTKLLIAMNLPSREQITAIGERLRSIEGELAAIRGTLSQSSKSDPSDLVGTFPPRTKQPPQRTGE
jgi:hypothetical protein